MENDSELNKKNPKKVRIQAPTRQKKEFKITKENKKEIVSPSPVKEVEIMPKPVDEKNNKTEFIPVSPKKVVPFEDVLEKIEEEEEIIPTFPKKIKRKSPPPQEESSTEEESEESSMEEKIVKKKLPDRPQNNKRKREGVSYWDQGTKMAQKAYSYVPAKDSTMGTIASILVAVFFKYLASTMHPSNPPVYASLPPAAHQGSEYLHQQQQGSPSPAYPLPPHGSIPPGPPQNTKNVQTTTRETYNYHAF